MPDSDDLSPEERAEIESIRSGASKLVDEITRLQMGWNHGAKATRVIDGARQSLIDIDSALAAP